MTAEIAPWRLTDILIANGNNTLLRPARAIPPTGSRDIAQAMRHGISFADIPVRERIWGFEVADIGNGAPANGVKAQSGPDATVPLACLVALEDQVVDGGVGVSRVQIVAGTGGACALAQG